MTKPLGGIYPIVMGNHYIKLQAAFYAFNFAKFLQHIFPHTNLKLQLKVVVICGIKCTLDLHPHWVVIQLDVENAFNLVLRGVIFQELHVVNDTHIIGPLSIVSFTYEHFQNKLCAIGFSIQPKKCIAWSPSSSPPDFNTPSQFTTPSKRNKVLGVPLGILNFTSSFIKDALLKDPQHVDLFFKMGVV